ncbi:flagellar basal body P-ring formation chaperone FlgA [Desulfonatronovibrio hydrogenovorans]|uniref:flagellar basal body P-ring formation chaperone FlgA n=1 Tax=Desulfonatronovibrio hydrogenovorans TaxID=53245 RepID=UPI0013783C1D|nr:flagellar basal body P-ring formation chaperone FlgA [Desulfonatronovibrio hydrogenovorans]
MKNCSKISGNISFLCLVVIMITCLQVNAQAAAHHYWIKEHVAVKGEVITFGDIAEPRTGTAGESWAEVKSIQLWRAPQAGQRIVLQRNQVLQRLGSIDRDLAEKSIVPREIIFQRGAKVYSEEELISIVMDHLIPVMRDMGDEVDFRDFRLPVPVFLENAFERIEIQTANEPAPGRVTLRINVLDGHDNMVRRLSGNVFVDVWATVACAQRPLNRGEILYPGDVRFERKNLAYVRNEIWDGKTGPWRIRSAIGQGQPILQRSLESVPVVSRGDQANLVFEGRYVTLSVPVRVLEDGQRGDRVMVRNLQTRKDIQGVVEDSSTILVR